MKDRIKDFFAFNNKEQRGLIILLGLMLLSLSVNIFLPVLIPEKEFDVTPFQKEVSDFLASVNKLDSAHQKYTSGFGEHFTEKGTTPVLSSFIASPFYFDPNEINEEQWINMGMDPKITRNIMRYREKGGTFRDKEGFGKIYGMPDSVFSILSPYLRFTGADTKPKILQSDEQTPKFKPYQALAPKEIRPDTVFIELNTADSALLLSLNGIGPSFAGRIIKFRERLGGFYQKEQLLEINGMDTVRLNQFIDRITVDSQAIRKIDLNTITFKNLLKHPYFEYYLVKAIFQRKDEVKKFDSIEQIKLIPVMYEELYEKISPYLEVMPGSKL